MRTSATLNTSPVNEPVSQQSDKYLYNNHHLPYYSVPYYVIMAIYITYIPFIMVSSSLVITAVILMKKHQNQHNIFLLAVAIYDLLIAVIVIPTRVLFKVAVTKETFYAWEYRGICISLGAIADTVEICSLNSLTLLGLDVVIQVTFPLKYRKIASIKKAFACLGTIALANLCSMGTFTYLRFSTNSHCSFENKIWSERWYMRYLAICAGILLLLCFFSGIYVRYKRNRRVTNTKGKTTTWLLMMYIIFYMPTLINLMKVIKFDNETSEFIIHIGRLVRYLSPLTNGPLIFHFRPTYSFAFKYFISTNPIYWNRIEKSYENYRKKSTLTAITTMFASAHNPTPAGSEREPGKKTDLTAKIKEEKSCERYSNRSYSCSRIGSSFIAVQRNLSNISNLSNKVN